MPPVAQMPRGADVSNWQPRIGWDAVAASGIAFAFCKASEGVTYRDPTFAPNWGDMKRLSIARGSYHFGQPDQNGPEDEAGYYVAAVQAVGIEPGDMLALDLEAGAGYLGDWALRFLQRVEALVGFKPLLYSSPGFIVDHGLNRVPELGQFGLWLASWGLSHLPSAPPPWDVIAFWQTADNGSVPGINGNVDLDLFNGPLESIRLYGKPEDVPGHVTDPGTVQSGPFAGMTLPELQAKAEGLLTTVEDMGDRIGDLVQSGVDQLRAERAQAAGVRSQP